MEFLLSLYAAVKRLQMKTALTGPPPFRVAGL